MPERYLGQTLGKYRIDAVIGSGGFAWVYKAFDPELEIPVALKILKPQYAGDESFEQRFRREASTAAKLRHPNIINIFAVGKEQGAVYFAMDYLPQGLADRLSVMTTLPESMLIRMAIDVSSALGFAHREGVIHRDIKTDNILFDEHGNAVVADFGIARAVAGYAEQTGTNMVMGTPQYFAPEQARGLQLDGRADIYSLGVTLFKAATGSLPFTGEDWYEIARQHVEEKPPRVRSLNASISADLEDVILRCLEKDPENRYPSGESMCEDLAGILHDRGETAARTVGVPTAATLPPGTPLPKLRRRRRQTSPVIWAIGGGAALVLLTLALTVGNGKSEPPPPATTGGGANAQTPLGSVLPGPRAAPPTAFPLTVIAANGDTAAAIRFEGQEKGRGRWSVDSLAPGRYTVSATVPTRKDCPTATLSASVLVGPVGEDTVRLFPRDCRNLTITTQFDGSPGNRVNEATYSLRTVGWFSGVKKLPPRGPLRILVPTGDYRVLIVVPTCTPYDASDWKVRVDTARTVKLICGVGG